MVKKTKKLFKSICFVTAASLLFSLCFGNAAFAQASSANVGEKTLIGNISVSEYDMFKKAKAKTDAELKKENFSDKEIANIRNFDYKKLFEERSNLDEKSLKAQGYSDEKIKVLKNFDGSEAQIYALSATLNMGLYKVGSAKSSSYSYADIMAFWQWDSQPNFWLKDAVAFAWSDGMYADSSQTTQTYSTVDYYLGSTYKTTIKFKPTVLTNIGSYQQFQLDGTYYWEHGLESSSIITSGSKSDLVGAWAKSGVHQVRIFKSSYISEFALLAKYGHTTIVIGSPTVTLAAQPSLGITFSFQTSDEKVCDMYVSL